MELPVLRLFKRNNYDISKQSITPDKNVCNYLENRSKWRSLNKYEVQNKLLGMK